MSNLKLIAGRQRPGFTVGGVSEPGHRIYTELRNMTPEQRNSPRAHYLEDTSKMLYRAALAHPSWAHAIASLGGN